MTFNEQNTIEEYVISKLSNKWKYIPSDQLGRDEQGILIESLLKKSLMRINPEIRMIPERADEVIYRLRAILLSVNEVGLVRANEEFTKWLQGEKTMPFGENNQHVPVRLIDIEDEDNNTFIVTNQYKVTRGVTKIPDMVLLINGIPVIVGEFKTPVRPAISWLDGAVQIHDDYENSIPELFVPNIFSFSSEGKTFRYGSIRMPLEIWGPWRDELKVKDDEVAGLREVEVAVEALLNPTVVMDILENFTIFATDSKNQRIKVIARYQQYEGANLILERVKQGVVKKGLIWHFQGSGKSLLMVFVAQKLRHVPELKSPTVVIIVDRVDLDTQITATFNACDVPNIVATESRDELERLLKQDTRKILITTMHKFAEAEGVLNDRENIIALVDEAHRTQEGDLGRKLRDALPNAFFFGLTGTPINKRDRNTFRTFSAEEDLSGYLSRYSFEESIRDKATLPLHFEPRLLDVHVDKELLDAGFDAMTETLTEEQRAQLVQKAGQMSAFLKAPDRVRKIVEDIVSHFREKIEPQGLKAQIVCPDRFACDQYKTILDEIVSPDESVVVISINNTDTDEFKRKYRMERDQQEKVLDRFRDPIDPLKFVIVTSKLLTGFDAPILQAMYLDKSMKDHNLLQAVCRTNRVYKEKSHGLIVDYYGVFDNVAKALEFDEKSVRHVITNIGSLKDQFKQAVALCLMHFPNVDRGIEGYEGLLLAQECVNTNTKRDDFAKDYSYLSKLWEALSPDSILNDYEKDYRWLSKIYESVKPTSGDTGRLLWHALGAQTIKLIHEHIHVEKISDDLEKIILDADVIEDLMKAKDSTKTKLIEIEIVNRLRKNKGKPKFQELGKRLEDLRDKAERGLINSVDFLKSLIELAKDVVAAEKEIEVEHEKKGAKSVLTELFLEVRTEQTPAIVERIINDIDEIVKVVRFPGWQSTASGEREVKKAIRKTLLKYKLHTDQDLFDRAYGYIREYY
ncbi:MAG: type I restriction endonuclease subunit R [Candidatus Tantalella remota]|nr:type I restriction endonuclease subunit R [Candidatus Tantalella remota]